MEVVVEAGAQGAVAVVLAEAVTEEEEWGTVVATVRATAVFWIWPRRHWESGAQRFVNAELPFAKHFAQRRKSSRQELFQPQSLDAFFGGTSHGSLFEGTPSRAG